MAALVSKRLISKTLKKKLFEENLLTGRTISEQMGKVVKSSQVTLTFIYIALFTIQIVSKQLHSDNMKIMQHRSMILLNIKCPQISKPKARQQWQGTKTPSGD